MSSPKKAKASKGKVRAHAGGRAAARDLSCLNASVSRHYGQATCKKATLQVVTKVLWPFRAKKSDVCTKKAAAETIEEAAAPAAPEEEGITAAPSSTAPVVQAV